MITIPHTDCIECNFGQNHSGKTEYASAKTEVFFAETVNFDSWFSNLKNYISNDEKLRADKFYSDTDRKTYVLCHAILRIILSARLNIHPLEIPFIKGSNNKPGLPDNQAFFNISHTREAFAIAFSKDFNVGIDLEKIKHNLDIRSIIKSYFSIKEQNCIHSSKSEEMATFFKLWTRKEALLKAIGTGITVNLNRVDVSGRVNLIEMKSFDSMNVGTQLSEYYIYSLKQQEYYLSIAIPTKSPINFYHLDVNNITDFLERNAGKERTTNYTFGNNKL